MSLRISGKHMDVGDAFRTRIEDRIGEAVGKYFDGNFSGHVVVEKSGSRFSTDCMIHIDTGAVLQATGEAQDPQLSFDAAMEKIDKRLRRYKRRLKSHKGAGESPSFDSMAYRVLEAAPEEEELTADTFAPAVVAETSMAVRSMTVAAAVLELDLRDHPVHVFRNAATGGVNIVYRRADGNIGWIDPSLIKSAGQ